MVNFTIEQVREIMQNPQHIRNISVIAHVDHGKSTLTDSLIAKAGLINERDAGKKRFTDGRKDEQERGITIKSTGVTLLYQLEQPCLINLIDSPGHVDFSAEVTAALRVTDGALVVVDAVEGVCVQTETVLRQACQERIKSVLMINKLDKVIMGIKLTGEEIYQQCFRAVEQVNNILDTYEGRRVDPTLGQVSFGAGKDCWGFTILDFAKPLAAKTNQPVEVIARKLWGENFYNTQTKKIQNEEVDERGDKFQRTFVYFILNPIIELFTAIQEDKADFVQQFISNKKLQIPNIKEKGELLRTIMSKWLNAADSLLAMIVNHLPSPKEAQVYRTDYLYEGSQDDEVAKAMKHCDPNGPLIMFISKFVPSNEKGHFLAFGRVFSGTLQSGSQVRVLGANYKVGKQEDLFMKKVSTVSIMMGAKSESIVSVPCGNTAAIAGLDNLFLKTATITTDPNASKIRSMKFSVSPIVRVAITTKQPKDLPKLIEGLQKLQATDNLVVWDQEESGQNVIGCCGDLHAEICVNDLNSFCKVPLVVSDPIVTYRETIDRESQVCMTKSANKLNRLYAQSQPLTAQLTEDIDKGLIFKEEPKERAKLLVEYEWEKQDALRIWSFGPDNVGPNILTELTQGIQNLHQIQEQMVQAWQVGTKAGVLIEEPMRGFRMNLLDCKIHEDAVHSGGGQVLLAARRLIHACQLSSQPRLQQPIFLTNITTHHSKLQGVYQVINQRKGIVIQELQQLGTPLIQVDAYIPVSESFGFAGYLRQMTQGEAFPQCTFDHWDVVKGDPFDQDSQAFQITMATRKRKGLKLELPKFNDYNDKL